MSHDMLTCTHLQFQLQFLQSIFQFYYPKDSKQQQNLLGCVMLWEFDILPSPTSQPVPPHVPETSDEHLDDSLPPVNLELPASCNCYKKPLNPVCLVNIPVPVGLEEETLGNDSTSSGQVNNEIEEIQQLTQLLEVEKAIVNSGENVGEDPDDLSAGEEYDNDNTGNPLGRNVDLYPEKFVVVGSWQERRYQQALAICMWRKSCKKELLFKIEHEPDNVRDKNALKFLVFHNDNWHIIGYCGINKIPKLKSALHQKEVHSISLDSLKRTYAFREQKLLYSASLMIIKESPWNKDDPMNKYNSNIIC